MTNSTFYGNTVAGYGGAIIDTAQGSGMFSRDVIYGNRAGGGGIDDADSSSIENSKIFGNHASAGGGLFIPGEDTTMVTGTSIRETARKMAAGSITWRGPCR